MHTVQYQRGAIDAGGCVSQAWELVKRNFGLYIGAGLVVTILISCIPFVNFLLIGPMMGGFAYIVLRDLRDEPVDFGMLFKGFEKFLPLMVLGLIQAIPGIIFQILQFVVDLSSLAGKSMTGETNSYQSPPPDLSALQTGAIAGVIIIFVGYFIFQMIWNAALVFAIPLVIERDVSIGEAITLSFGAVFNNLGGLTVLVIINALVGILGFLACLVGIFVAIPVTFAAYVIAYRYVFPNFEPSRVNTAPPPPDTYGNFGQGM
ncbi:MAG: hypothetical protein ABI481_03525 [Pyrinomonadaceae bacterium]